MMKDQREGEVFIALVGAVYIGGFTGGGVRGDVYVHGKRRNGRGSKSFQSFACLTAPSEKKRIGCQRSWTHGHVNFVYIAM